jgi:hypothetical protein
VEPTAEAEPKPKPSTAASSPKPKAAAAGGAKKAAKAVVKSLLETMVEDVVPRLTAFLEKEKGVSDVDIEFADNQVFVLAAGVGTLHSCRSCISSERKNW